MEIQQQRSHWKIYLGIAGVAILLISLVYTTFLAERLKVGERNKALLMVFALEAVGNPDEDADLTLASMILEQNNDIPMLVVNNNDEVMFARNFGEEQDSNRVFLMERLARIKKKGPEPIKLFGTDNQLLYYQNSRLHDLLTYFPIFQLLLLIAFVTIGYISINNARRAEQNRVWVGMAKETAHQLGTPISAIIGWIEHLRDSYQQTPDELEILKEMQNDVDRLDLIADRFSKIGSAPALTEVNIYDQMREITTYIRRRAPRKVEFTEPPADMPPLMVNINQPLFNWVIENLMRNALDAMEEGVGTIAWVVTNKADHVEIDVSDTGKGIHPSKVKSVFEPGFTTKSRGWGLGLSLARRIIENYHKGRIYVKHSRVGEGTTFAIHLPHKK